MYHEIASERRDFELHGGMRDQNNMWARANKWNGHATFSARAGKANLGTRRSRKDKARKCASSEVGSLVYGIAEVINAPLASRLLNRQCDGCAFSAMRADKRK